MGPSKKKTLILTEKPSVARDFARALGVASPRGRVGWMENDDYIVTWAVGHLVELLEPGDYDPRWKKWRMENLPIIPDRFRYKPISKTKKQLDTIRAFFTRRAVDKVVIATDAGREGEVIARTILLSAGVPCESLDDRPDILRFWTSQALTPEVVRKGMAKLSPAGEYDRLWRAGQARQIADWLVGMNGSRSATLTMDDLFSVGRVQTAVLALLVDRRRERENFKPEPYWILKARFENPKGDWWGSWFQQEETRFLKEEDARREEEKIRDREGVVVFARKQKKKQPPPLLHSLTDLQRDANTRHGFFAKKTLGLAQALYEEKKCLSYPRTESRVLGTQNVDLVKEIVGKLSRSYPDLFDNVLPERIDARYRRVFNDALLTDHHAIVPLAPLPQRATDDEKKIYDLVLKRFAAAFHPDCEYEQTVIVTEVEKETFRTQGKRILKPGWRAVHETEKKVDKGEKTEKDDSAEPENLPPLEKNDPAAVAETKIDRKETLPPPEYTDALLLRDMTNPGRYVGEDELKKIYRGEIGLGTQSTRAQIIETLISRKYAGRQKRLLVALDKGCLLVDTLRRFQKASILTSPEETARWEMRLDGIARGEESGETFLNHIRTFIQEIVEEFKAGKAGARTPLPGPGRTKTFGRCPRCGGEIIEGNRGYGCSNWREQDGACRFVVWKNISGKKIPESAVRQLLQKGVTPFISGFVTPETGGKFSARLKIAEDKDGQANVFFDY